MCRSGIKLFDVHLGRIRLVFFLSKGGKEAAYEGTNEVKVSFSRRSPHFLPLELIWLEYFSLFLLWLGV